MSPLRGRQPIAQRAAATAAERWVSDKNKSEPRATRVGGRSRCYYWIHCLIPSLSTCHTLCCMLVWNVVMSHSFVNLSVHIIFHIKTADSFIKEAHLARAFHYIGGTIRAMSGHVYMVGGRPDHIHILTSLPASMSLSDFVRSVKANTSRWIKGLDICYSNFSWQKGYGAFSVSESNKDSVIHYISNQEEHHRKQSAEAEFLAFLRKHHLDVEK